MVTQVEWIVLGVLFFFFFVGACITTFMLLSRWRWKYKVTILEDVTGSGIYQPTKKDRARLIKFGDGGEEIFYLKKLKRYRVAYGKRVGKNYIAWAIGQDGYWYNITFGNLDKKLLEVGVSPVDRDMRFAMASLRKGIETRYNEKTFFEKWGVPITIGILIIGIIAQGVTTYYILSKQKEITNANVEGTRVSLEVMKLAKEVLGDVDTIKGTGGGTSGLVPVV
jgi:hypothetical protein